MIAPCVGVDDLNLWVEKRMAEHQLIDFINKVSLVHSSYINGL